MDETKTPYMNAVENAFERFNESGFNYGDVVQSDWFWSAFFLKKTNNHEEMSRNQILHNRYLGALRKKLLVEKQMLLVSFDGIGQRIVHPDEQTDLAMRDAKTNITKELNKATLRLVNTNQNLLSQENKRENSDAIAHLTFFSNRTAKQLTW